jgi:hypothetical protein
MLHPESLRLVSRRRRVTAAVALLAVAALVVAACTSDGGDAIDEPESPQLSLPEPTYDDVAVVTLPEGFVQPDTRGVRLSPVVGRPRGGTPALPVYGGRASIGGVVVGPDGPVDGATVRIERWVGNRSGSVQVSTGGGGRFGARGLLGGRYRVRAWLEPSLTATRSEVTFLADDGGSANLNVTMERFEGQRLQASLDVSVINVDESARVRALFTRVVVDGDGIVIGEPVPGASIQLTATPGLAVDGDGAATTDGSGLASWRVTCQREGAHSVSLTADGASTSYTLPNCGPKSTTTTQVEIPPFAVGEEFVVPRSAPLPPGTYTAVGGGESCATSFEAYVGSGWQAERREIRGAVLGLLVPARNFQAVQGTDPCRYRRTA